MVGFCYYGSLYMDGVGEGEGNRGMGEMFMHVRRCEG